VHERERERERKGTTQLSMKVPKSQMSNSKAVK